MNDADQENKSWSFKTGCLLWCFSVLCLGGGCVYLLPAGWLFVALGLFLMTIASAFLSKKLAHSIVGMIGLGVFLFLSGLIIALSIFSTTCSSYHI
ncbi:hypothetical protein BH11VER1_BH11VER1_02600 [soil metagenome]